ncbi:MAG: prepilin-type N-terminal cleavage/methylation domain-containing protein [Candidatus Curtissbacteria bacterium]
MPKLSPSPFNLHPKKGFTLIELLVVISIIGILSALAVASFSGAQARARDGQRKNDFDQIKKALELAKSDSTGASYYPNTLTFNVPLPNGGANSGAYMKKVPLDPRNTGAYIYTYTGITCAGTWPTGGCTGYRLSTSLENSSDPQAAQSQSQCLFGTGAQYSVCND